MKGGWKGWMKEQKEYGGRHECMERHEKMNEMK